MKKQGPAKSVERMFPFVLRSRILLVGRDTLLRSKSKLHFVLVTEDLSESSRAAVLEDFAHYPIIQHYASEDLDRFFGLKGTKVIGFEKSGLAQSIYAELKEYRINKPVKP
jgi:hypothetical protein